MGLVEAWNSKTTSDKLLFGVSLVLMLAIIVLGTYDIYVFFFKSKQGPYFLESVGGTPGFIVDFLAMIVASVAGIMAVVASGIFIKEKTIG